MRDIMDVAVQNGARRMVMFTGQVRNTDIGASLMKHWLTQQPYLGGGTVFLYEWYEWPVFFIIWETLPKW